MSAPLQSQYSLSIWANISYWSTTCACMQSCLRKDEATSHVSPANPPQVALVPDKMRGRGNRGQRGGGVGERWREGRVHHHRGEKGWRAMYFKHQLGFPTMARCCSVSAWQVGNIQMCKHSIHVGSVSSLNHPFYQKVHIKEPGCGDSDANYNTTHCKCMFGSAAALEATASHLRHI